MVGSLGDPDPSDCLFHSSWHNPPSMITIQMMVREKIQQQSTCQLLHGQNTHTAPLLYTLLENILVLTNRPYTSSLPVLNNVTVMKP